MKFTKERIKGCGTYGTLYEGEIKYNDGRIDKGCLKVISHYTNVAGIGNFREIQLLQTLSQGCIYFPKILGVVFEEYTEKPLNTDKIKKNEYLTFVTELMEYSGEKYFGSADYSLNDAIDMMSQFMSAITYMHSKFITHRDIKPANLLISILPNGKHLVKICDMGLSHILSSSARSTPGVFSPWYRPPEILYGSHRYGSNSDIWAAGCTMYEMLGCGVFVYVDSQDDEVLFYKILEVNPNQWTSEIHELYKKSSNKHFSIKGSLNPVTLPFGEQLFPKFRSSKYFHVKDLPVWQKCESLLKKCFNYNYNERATGWKLMHDDLFDPFREQMNFVKNEITKLRVHETIDFHISREINDRKVSTFDRFYRKANGGVHIRQLFHATDLANRVLSSTAFANDLEKDTEKLVSLCIYNFNKYFAIMRPSEDPIHYFDCLDIKTPSDLSDLYRWIYETELKMIREIFPKFNVMRQGIYEMPEEYGQFLTHEQAVKIYGAYVRMNEWGGGNTYRSLYRKLYNECIDPNYKFVPLVKALTLSDNKKVQSASNPLHSSHSSHSFNIPNQSIQQPQRNNSYMLNPPVNIDYHNNVPVATAVSIVPEVTNVRSAPIQPKSSHISNTENIGGGGII